VHDGYKSLDGKTGVEPEESELVASVELGHVQVLEGQEVDTSSSSPNYVEHLLAIIVLQVPQVIQHALLQNQHTPHPLQCPIPPPVSSCPATASVNGLLAGASTEDEQQIKCSMMCDALYMPDLLILMP
jgi:hypothetical protein